MGTDPGMADPQPRETPAQPPTEPPTDKSAEKSSEKGSGQTPGKAGRARTEDPLRGSRTSGVWVALVAVAVLLLLLVIFIAQNTRQARLTFLWWDTTTPLSVALLLAAAIGIMLTAMVGTLRILQLRRRVQRARR